MVLKRELLHFFRDRVRSAVALFQPLVFLFVLGVGLSQLITGTGSGGGDGSARNYMTFLFPGVLVMAVEAPAISAGASVVFDRQSGFLREMLVAPVRRSTLLVAKCLGGATVATLQGLVLLACAGLVGVPYRLDLLLLLAGEMALAALAMTALGTLVAVMIRKPQTFNAVLGLMMTPLIFLSGLMFPMSAMPRWVEIVSFFNPLTYAVDILRRTVSSRLPGPTSSSGLFEPVSWGSWTPSPLLEVFLLAAFTGLTLMYASRRFGRIE